MLTADVILIPPASTTDEGHYLLIPKYVPVDCKQIDSVITNNLPFTINEIKLKPCTTSDVRSLNDEV